MERRRTVLSSMALGWIGWSRGPPSRATLRPTWPWWKKCVGVERERVSVGVSDFGEEWVVEEVAR